MTERNNTVNQENALTMDEIKDLGYELSNCYYIIELSSIALEDRIAIASKDNDVRFHHFYNLRTMDGVLDALEIIKDNLDDISFKLMNADNREEALS